MVATCSLLCVRKRRNGKIQDEGEKVDSPDDGRKVLDLSRWNTISTLDSVLDELLGGGIPTGYLTEVTGERYNSSIVLDMCRDR